MNPNQADAEVSQCIPPPQIVYTVQDLLKILRVSRPTLYKVLTDGDLPSSKVGARRLVTHDNLMRFLKDREVRA